MSRFFVDYNGVKGPPSTLLLSDVKAETFLEQLIDTYIAQYSVNLDPTLVTLSTSPDVDPNGIRGGENVLRYCKKVGDLGDYFDEFAKGGGDLFIVDCDKRERQGVSTKSTPTASTSIASSKSISTSTFDDDIAEIKKTIKNAKLLYQKKQYKQSCKPEGRTCKKNRN